MEDVVGQAIAEIETLPASVRMDALAQIQRQIMAGVIEEQSRG